MARKEIILIGGGGHCRACIDVIEAEGKFKIAGIIDQKENIGKAVLGYTIIGSDEDLPRLVKKYRHFLITIGQIKIFANRIQLYGRLKELGADLPTIVSPVAYVSEHAKLGEGTIIMHKAVVNAGAQLGKNCIVNTGAIIEHDAVIGDHTHVSTGCVINGCAQIGGKVFIGSKSVVRESLNVGDEVILGAGSVVVKDLAGPGTYVGHPAARKTKDLKILFLAKKEKPFAEEAAEMIKEHVKDAQIVFGDTDDPFPEHLMAQHYDYIISYISPWVLPKTVLDKARVAAINFHPGPPDYPGIGCTNFAIYNGEKQYGITVHHMAEKVDTGGIIATEFFSISEADTVFSLTHKCYAYIYAAFVKILPLILRGEAMPKSTYQWTRKPYTRKELNELCRLTKSMPEEEVRRRIKATEFPGMPGAYWAEDVAGEVRHG